jgi:hypothetical protein
VMDILESGEALLNATGFATSRFSSGDRKLVAFEGSNSLGFLFGYADADSLLSAWSVDIDWAISHYQFQLRKAGQKAWNAYAILLVAEPSDYSRSMRLSAIEEDLSGTRKIVRAGVANEDEVRAALLPLMEIQNSPVLPAVDITNEIRLRTTELPSRVVEAFLSDAEEAVVIQVLEEEK